MSSPAWLVEVKETDFLGCEILLKNVTARRQLFCYSLSRPDVRGIAKIRRFYLRRAIFGSEARNKLAFAFALRKRNGAQRGFQIILHEITMIFGILAAR